MTDRHRWEGHRDRALEDLTALEAQVASGEIGETVADGLRSRYEAEAATAMRQLESLPPEVSTSRSTKRTLWTLGVLTLVAAAIVVGLVQAIEPRTGGFVTGGPERSPGVDLATVTNEELEEVVAANPEIVPMRLALARRYVEAGDFSSALPHYLFVLERERNPEALMYLGWMTHLSGDPVTGESLLEQSLEVQPQEPLALWFLANIRFYGLADPEGAIAPLEALLASGAAPLDIEQEARRMLEEARS